jgi:hypothetical protein
MNENNSNSQINAELLDKIERVDKYNRPYLLLRTNDLEVEGIFVFPKMIAESE